MFNEYFCSRYFKLYIYGYFRVFFFWMSYSVKTPFYFAHSTLFWLTSLCMMRRIRCQSQVPINAHRAPAKFQPSIPPRASRTTIVSVYSPTMRQTFQLDRALAGCSARCICLAVLGRETWKFIPGEIRAFEFLAGWRTKLSFLPWQRNAAYLARLIVYKKAILLESISAFSSCETGAKRSPERSKNLFVPLCVALHPLLSREE